MFRKIFCRHEYQKRTFTAVECKKCERVKRDEKMAVKLLKEFFQNRIDRGTETKESINRSLARSCASTFLMD